MNVSIYTDNRLRHERDYIHGFWNFLPRRTLKGYTLKYVTKTIPTMSSRCAVKF